MSGGAARVIDGVSDDALHCYKNNLFDGAIVGVGGDLEERERIFCNLKKLNIPTPNIVDSSVQLRMGVKIGMGNVILGNSYFGPEVEIGNNCYILNGVSVQHNSRIGDHTYLASGVLIGAFVTVGNKVRFEIGSGAKSRIKVSDSAIISAGIILAQDIN